MAAGGLRLPKELRLDAGGCQGLTENASLRAQNPRVPNREPRPGHGDGLVEPLAAAVDLAAQAGPGLPGLDELIHGINIVKIQGTEIQDLHALASRISAPEGVFFPSIIWDSRGKVKYGLAWGPREISGILQSFP